MPSTLSLKNNGLHVERNDYSPEAHTELLRQASEAELESLYQKIKAQDAALFEFWQDGKRLGCVVTEVLAGDDGRLELWLTHVAAKDAKHYVKLCKQCPPVFIPLAKHFGCVAVSAYAASPVVAKFLQKSQFAMQQKRIEMRRAL